MSSMRFDLRVPVMDSNAVFHQCRAASSRAQWSYQHEAPFQIGRCEHHALLDGYMSSLYVMASAMAAVIARTPMTIAALLSPFCDPVPFDSLKTLLCVDILVVFE